MKRLLLLLPVLLLWACAQPSPEPSWQENPPLPMAVTQPPAASTEAHFSNSLTTLQTGLQEDLLRSLQKYHDELQEKLKQLREIVK